MVCHIIERMGHTIPKTLAGQLPVPRESLIEPAGLLWHGQDSCLALQLLYKLQSKVV